MRQAENAGGGSKAGDPILYKCPYCVKGQFGNPDGWKRAKEHIKTHARKDYQYKPEVHEAHPHSGLFDEASF